MSGVSTGSNADGNRSTGDGLVGGLTILFFASKWAVEVVVAVEVEVEAAAVAGETIDWLGRLAKRRLVMSEGFDARRSFPESRTRDRKRTGSCWSATGSGKLVVEEDGDRGADEVGNTEDGPENIEHEHRGGFLPHPLHRYGH